MFSYHIREIRAGVIIIINIIITLTNNNKKIKFVYKLVKRMKCHSLSLVILHIIAGV